MTIRGTRVLILMVAGAVSLAGVLAGCSTATRLGDAVPADQHPVVAANPPTDAASSPDITGSVGKPRTEQTVSPPKATPSAPPPETPLLNAILPLMLLGAGT
jgi:hypothetical protein